MRFFENGSGNLQRYADVFNLVPIDNPLYILFWIVSTVAILWLLQRKIVRRENLKIQFFITDFWAAIIALAPSFFLLVDLADVDEAMKLRQIGLFVLTFFSILAGIRAWLILALPKRDEPLPGRWSHFLSVLSGGIAGLLGVFVSVFAFSIVAFVCVYVPTTIYYMIFGWVGLCYVMPPLLIVSAVCFYIAKQTYDQLRR